MIEFRKAEISDAPVIVKTRQKVWDAAYRGIYPDEAIDQFDYEWHLEAEQRRLGNRDFYCWMVLDGENCVGYFSCGPWKRNSFRLHSLYLLPGYQKLGLGRSMFEQVKSFCLSKGYQTMWLDCHPENQKAIGFYRHMGGVVTGQDIGHENRQEDSCTIEYYFT